MSDGKKKMRFVGFSYELSDKIAEVCKEGKAVHLSNCTVKKDRSSDSLEVILNDFTEVSQSDKNFEIDSLRAVESTNTAKTITLDQIKGEVQYQRVNVNVIVSEIGNTTVSDDGRRVQNVVADVTGTSSITQHY